MRIESAKKFRNLVSTYNAKSKIFKIRPGFILLTSAFLLAAWLISAQPSLFALKKALTTFQASSDELKKSVQKISEDFFPRDFESVENLNRLAASIKDQFSLYTPELREQNYSAENRTYKNIVAQFGPKDRPVLVVGAHYDSCGKYPAADDNASGVAGLFEIARFLKLNPPQNFQVQLVAYSTEEPPFFSTNNMGSFIHAQSLKAEGIQVVGMISLEMIGYFSEKAGSQEFPALLMRLFYPSKGNFIAVVSNYESYFFTGRVKSAMQSAGDLPVYSMNGPSAFYGIGYSDQRNYWKFGFPAVMVTDTAFLRNKAYHSSIDTYNRLDYEKMAGVIDGVCNFLAKTDEDLKAD